MTKFTLLATTALLSFPLLAMAGLGLTRKGYESPAFEVVKKEKGFEVRDYEAMELVSTDMSGDQGDKGFMRLFKYIDKGNEENQKISMTTPVFIEGSRESGTMSFVVPEEIAEKGSPAPNAKEVKLAKMESTRFAVLRFKGSKSEKKAKAAEKKLRELISKKGYRAVPGTVAFLAYYDPPWTPEPLRKNEVLVPILKKD